MILVFEDLHVVKRNIKADDTIPLAFIVPQDGSKSRKNQIETARKWARDYTEVEIKNTPRAGFKVSESIRRSRSWGGGNIVWRMVDPAGFEFEIPTENMAQIICTVGISPGGEIPVSCIYGREGKTNILLPEGTEFYKNTVTPLEVAVAKVQDKLKMSEIKVGQPLLSDFSHPDYKYSGTYIGRVEVKYKDDPKPQIYFAKLEKTKWKKEEERKILVLSKGFNLKRSDLKLPLISENVFTTENPKAFYGNTKFKPYYQSSYWYQLGDPRNVRYFMGHDGRNYQEGSPKAEAYIENYPYSPERDPRCWISYAGFGDSDKIEELTFLHK